jgi:hypothetical protein
MCRVLAGNARRRWKNSHVSALLCEKEIIIITVVVIIIILLHFEQNVFQVLLSIQEPISHAE